MYTYKVSNRGKAQGSVMQRNTLEAHSMIHIILYTHAHIYIHTCECVNVLLSLQKTYIT